MASLTGYYGPLCSGCISCQKCNSGCQGTCDLEQSLCTLKGCQTYAQTSGTTFKWIHCVSQNEIIGPGKFDKTDWAKIISYINTALKLGTKSSTGGTLAAAVDSNLTPFKASEYNRIASKINSTTHKTNDIIYGKYFSDLANCANNAEISATACDDCNTGCNVDCDVCQKCNSGCNSSCNAQYIPYSYCCGCLSGDAPAATT